MFVVNREAIQRTFTMTDCIAAVEEGLVAWTRGAAFLHPRFQLPGGPSNALMGLMPVVAIEPERLWGLKAVMVAHGNPQQGLDSHQGAILICNAETGVPLALVDATEITAMRTAAASALATRALAKPDVGRIAILGTGRQARTHVEALRVGYPKAEFRLWGRSPKAEALAQSIGACHAVSVQEAIDGADVICTVTGSREPLLKGGWITPGCHINAVGASRPDARELDSDLVARSEFFVDSRSQAETECGEYLIPLGEGRIGTDHIRAELGAILAGQAPGRSSPAAVTVFKSLGIAVEDLWAAARALECAKAAGQAQQVRW
ncbi:ornithine cyclodeaminase family protein [Rhizobium sp. RU36D]|uniref:ornithine cyclodeaminase family protein n=1 Tax=Rhizobium sp. RU36D TaxID=1907415 RepID=UPI0009D82999|nr:ornithine cyclodeaminase family protein [Rhizobium sp. RU36D]SMC71565.1 ornithine cyclodeaminase [Rhizobium sp. RU36D]